MRMLEAISVPPSEGERERYAELVQTIAPGRAAEQLYLGMESVPLTRTSVTSVEPADYGSLEPFGLACQLARVTAAVAAPKKDVKQITQQDVPAERMATFVQEANRMHDDEEDAAEREQMEQETVAGLVEDWLRKANIEQEVQDQPTEGDRWDTLIVCTADNALRAVPRVLLQNENKLTMLTGKICLRKIRLSDEERLRINSAFNVLQRDYLTYYTYADEAAVAAGADILSDAHQAAYDKHFEIVFAVSDCLLVHTRQVNNPYLQRVTLVHNLTEMPVPQDTTQAYKRRKDAIDRAVAYSGGEARLQMTIFLRPFWSVKHIRASMHAVPACLQGTIIDGVVLTPNDAIYEPGANAKLLHYSAGAHTEMSEDDVIAAVIKRTEGK